MPVLKVGNTTPCLVLMQVPCGRSGVICGSRVPGHGRGQDPELRSGTWSSFLAAGGEGMYLDVMLGGQDRPVE